MKKINVIVKEPGKDLRRAWISDSLENLQSIVGGYIETVTFDVHDVGSIVMIVNENGKLGDFKANFRCGNDFVFGTAIFCGTDGEEFTDIPMRDGCVMTLTEFAEVIGGRGIRFVPAVNIPGSTVHESVTERIERIAEYVCENICKYNGKGGGMTDEELEALIFTRCDNCPINML